MSKLRITPIGTCRIHTPLKRAVSRYPVEVDLRRNYGFVHTSAEALQLIRFLRGEKEFTAEVAPLVIRNDDLNRFAAEEWEVADLHIVEISSAKRISCGDDAIQLNYLTTHFADFFASRERARQFWNLLRNRDRKDLVEFLSGEDSFRILPQKERELLLGISIEQQSFNSIKADMREIVEHLGKDRLVFMTHVNGRAPDGNLIPSRDRLIRWVKLAAKELEVQCFDPTAYLDEFGQERALEQNGFDLTHYTPPFADHIYDALHRSYVTELLSGIIDGPEDPEHQYAMVAGQFEAMLQFGDFIEVSRKILAAARATPDALPLVELRGLVRARIGDYEGALEDLTRRGDHSRSSQQIREALLDALHQSGKDEQALRAAEELIGDEFENPKIYRIAFEAAERLGKIETAAGYAKQAFRRNRKDVSAALHALVILESDGQAAECAALRAEILEYVDEFTSGSFEICAWAIAHRDEELFEAAVPALADADHGAATDLLELALKGGLNRAAASVLGQFAKLAQMPASLERRGAEAALAAVEQARELFAAGSTAEAFALARPAGAFRAAASQSRGLVREISLEVRSLVRDAYLRGDHSAVVAIADSVTDVILGNARTVLLVARSLASLGRNREMLVLLKKGHAENPQDFALRRWTGRTAAQESDYATALRMYGGLDRDAPEFDRTRAEIERFFTTVERRAAKKLRELFDADAIDEALDLVDELKLRTNAADTCDRELARKHRQLRLKLIEIEQGEGDTEQREAILRLMMRIKPDDTSALRRLALECMRQLKFAEAAECWEALRTQSPENESAIRNQERCQILAKRTSSSFTKAAA